MSYERSFGGINNVLNTVGQIPEVVSAFIRINGVLRRINKANEAAQRGDVGSWLIAHIAMPVGGYGGRVNRLDLRVNPNDNNDRTLMMHMRSMLRSHSDLKRPKDVLAVSRFVDMKVLEVNIGNI